MTDNMAVLAVLKRRDRRLKDMKRRAVGLEKGDRVAVATKVVVEEFPELTSQLRSFTLGEKDDMAMKQPEDDETRGPNGNESESEISEYNSETDEEW